MTVQELINKLEKIPQAERRAEIFLCPTERPDFDLTVKHVFYVPEGIPTVYIVEQGADLSVLRLLSTDDQEL